MLIPAPKFMNSHCHLLSLKRNKRPNVVWQNTVYFNFQMNIMSEPRLHGHGHGDTAKSKNTRHGHGVDTGIKYLFMSKLTYEW